jgi:hypothetical protein
MKKVNIDTLYCNGDSWAYGAELEDVSDSFVNVISDHYKLPVVNSSWPGGSNHRILRTTIEDVSRLLKQGKSPFVLISWTLPHRFELFSVEQQKFVTFSSPGSAADEELGNILWSKWSSDKTDVINFLTQVISLQSFLKQNNVPYFMTNVFKVVYELLDKTDIELYQSQIDTTYYMYNLPFKVLLTPYINIKWGTDHPLKDGHAIIAKFLIEQIDIRYNLITV